MSYRTLLENVIHTGDPDAYPEKEACLDFGTPLNQRNSTVANPDSIQKARRRKKHHDPEEQGLPTYSSSSSEHTSVPNSDVQDTDTQDSDSVASDGLLSPSVEMPVKNPKIPNEAYNMRAPISEDILDLLLCQKEYIHPNEHMEKCDRVVFNAYAEALNTAMKVKRSKRIDDTFFGVCFHAPKECPKAHHPISKPSTGQPAWLVPAYDARTARYRRECVVGYIVLHPLDDYLVILRFDKYRKLYVCADLGSYSKRTGDHIRIKPYVGLNDTDVITHIIITKPEHANVLPLLREAHKPDEPENAQQPSVPSIRCGVRPDVILSVIPPSSYIIPFECVDVPNTRTRWVVTQNQSESDTPLRTYKVVNAQPKLEFHGDDGVTLRDAFGGPFAIDGFPIKYVFEWYFAVSIAQFPRVIRDTVKLAFARKQDILIGPSVFGYMATFLHLIPEFTNLQTVDDPTQHPQYELLRGCCISVTRVVQGSAFGSQKEDVFVTGSVVCSRDIVNTHIELPPVDLPSLYGIRLGHDEDNIIITWNADFIQWGMVPLFSFIGHLITHYLSVMTVYVYETTRVDTINTNALIKWRRET
jgi:hypothetical protein